MNISTDDTLAKGRSSCCDVLQGIHELDNESGCEEFPSKWLKFTRKKKKKTFILFTSLMLFPYFKIHIGKSIEPWNFGPPYLCVYCGSWYEERTVKSKSSKNLKFSLSCMEGKVKLPLLKKVSPLIDELLQHSFCLTKELRKLYLRLQKNLQRCKQRQFQIELSIIFLYCLRAELF